jgi:hypothetical protein
MAKQAEPTHRRIPYRVRVRLKALGRLCAHSSASVAAAAHKEIGAIHRKYLLGRASRMRAWFGNLGRAGVRKVTPHQLHKPLRLNAAPAKAPKRGHATPIRAHMPKGGFTPLTDHTLTRAELRQRTKAAKQARRNGQPVPQPARQPDAMQQATESMRRQHAQPQGARSPGRPGQTSPFTQHTAGPSRSPVPDAGYAGQQPRRASDGAAKVPGTFTEDVARSMPGGAHPSRIPPLPGHPEAVRKAAEDKRSWSGLAKHLADAPARVRTGRARNRTTA